MTEHSGKILAVMSDLFFAAKINDAAKRLGMAAEFVQDRARALEKARSAPPLMIFDLNCASADAPGLIAAIKSDPETAGIPMVGFVSHVQTDLKRRAEEAGCDTVVARSVFAQNLAGILERYL